MPALRPPLARPRILCVLLLATLVAALAAAVTLSATLARADAFVVAGVHAGFFRPALDAAFLTITELGANHALLAGTLGGAVALAAARRWHGAAALLVAVPATQAVVGLLKEIVERARPGAETAVAQAPGFSFPSGHAASTMALYATLGFVLARECRGRLRIAVAVLAGLVVISVGASRVYLGVHYPTDVLAGWLTAAALAIAAWSLVGGVVALRGPART